MDNLVHSRGMTQAILAMIDDPEFLENLNEICLINSVNRAKVFMECGIDGIYLGDASSSSSIISPQHFIRYSLPNLTSFVNEIKKSGVLIYLHICGNVRAIIDFLPEIGTDCLEPLDPLR